MARITIEDCLQNVTNRFQLVLIAAKRARQLALGSAEATVSWENDKPSVVALREVASGKLFFTSEGEVRAANDQEDDQVMAETMQESVADSTPTGDVISDAPATTPTHEQSLGTDQTDSSDTH